MNGKPQFGRAYDIALACGHIQKFKLPMPQNGETVLCRSCREYRIVKLKINQWRARCKQCNYSRQTGVDIEYAKIIARKHSLNCKHVTYVFRWFNDKQEITATFGEQDETLVDTTSDQSEIPF